MSERIAAYTPDLMDRSKIANALPGTRFVASPEALVGLSGTDVVLLDLSKRGVIDVLADIVATSVRVVAYGSHVDRALLQRARDAGCDEVLSRSAFFAGLARLAD